MKVRLGQQSEVGSRAATSTSNNYAAKDLHDTVTDAFRELMGNYPEGCCVGFDWKLSIRPTGKAVILLPYSTRVNKLSQVWTNGELAIELRPEMDGDGIYRPHRMTGSSLTGVAGNILDSVLFEMQDAEEIWGPGEDGYVPLMKDIAAESTARIGGFCENLREREEYFKERLEKAERRIAAISEKEEEV
jgi:hypothetical protein